MSKEAINLESSNSTEVTVRAVGYGTRSYVELPPDLFDPHAYRAAESRAVLGSRDHVPIVDPNEGFGSLAA